MVSEVGCCTDIHHIIWGSLPFLVDTDYSMELIFE